MAFNRPRPELYNEERKMQIYNFITDYINEYGVSPSIPEMADEFHVSKATIHKYLVRLQDQQEPDIAWEAALAEVVLRIQAVVLEQPEQDDYIAPYKLGRHCSAVFHRKKPLQ